MKHLEEVIINYDKKLMEANAEIERLNNIINTMLDFNFFKEECPLNFGYTEKCDEEKAQDVFYEDDYCEENCNDDYKKCWLKYFERLQELKGSNNGVWVNNLLEVIKENNIEFGSDKE